MEKFYYMTTSKGRGGCSNITWRVTEDYRTKAEVKRQYKGTNTRVAWIYTEQELSEHFNDTNIALIRERAR